MVALPNSQIPEYCPAAQLEVACMMYLNMLASSLGIPFAQKSLP